MTTAKEFMEVMGYNADQSASEVSNVAETHTLLPWYAERGANISHVNFNNNGHSGSICEMNMRGERARANASFIACACNNHYDLIQALESLVALDDGDNRTAWKHAELFDKARLVLEKARGI